MIDVQVTMIDLRSIRSRTLKALAFVGITCGLFLLFEGGASLLIFLRVLQTELEPFDLREMAYAEYDSELGWAGRPNAAIADFYGHGKHMITNSQGFRSEVDIAREVPDGMRRLICSGDSFTLGYGVANRDTWCAQLAVLSPGLQTVNMGQGGYGIDQAYLWYRRDGLPLEHNFQILAFISDDFLRIGAPRFLGYGKPYITLEEGRMRVDSARRHGVLSRWLAKNGHVFERLRSVDLSGRALQRLGLGSRKPDKKSERRRVWEIAEAIFDDLREEHHSRGSQLILVFLPAREDRDTEHATPWRQLVSSYSEKQGIQYVDLVEEYRAMEPREAESMFFRLHELGMAHLNERGNLWVAERLAQRVPQIRGS